VCPDPIPRPLDWITTYIYDGAGRITAMRDGPGTVTWITYDSEGRRVDRGTEPPAPPPEEPDEPHIVE
jgi:YD repeat-containing protein